jgi:hypothetical protein
VSGVLTIAYENKLDNDSPTHVFMATSIDNGATWTCTTGQLDMGVGSALLPVITPAVPVHQRRYLHGRLALKRPGIEV